MPVKKGDKGALKRPLIAYRVKIICKDPENDIEGLATIEDILDSEDFIECLNDLHAHYTWLFEIYEFEDMGKIELWSRKDVRHWGNWRQFYSKYGYGENLHL